MGKRFSRYEFALDTLRTLTNGEDSNTQGVSGLNVPENTALGNYQKYAKRDFRPSYNRDDNSLPEQILTARIIPFGIPTTNAPKYLVSFSKRAQDNAGNGVVAACNHNAVEANENIIEAQDFIPAKAIITLPGEGAETTPTSQITGRKYKKKPKRSYTYPYGKSATNEFERAVRTSITQTALAANNAAKITFNSERF